MIATYVTGSGRILPIGRSCGDRSVLFLSDTGTPATDSYTPVTAAIPAPTIPGSIALAALMLDNPFDYLGADLTVDAPWVMIQGDLHTGDIDYIQSMRGVAILPGGGGGSPVFRWGGTFVRAGVRRILGVGIDTNATAPVQTGDFLDPSSFVTMPQYLTPGNLLVQIVMFSTVVPSLAGPGIGWTLAKSINMADSDVTIADHGTGPWSKWGMMVAYRCVGAGEGGSKVVDAVFSTTFNHYVFISEWPPPTLSGGAALRLHGAVIDRT